MSKININAYGEIQNDPDLSYEILYDPASNNTFKKKRDTWRTKTIKISSDEILSCGTTAIVLLEAPGVGKFYEWEATLKYHFVTSAYTMGSPFTIQQGTINKFPLGVLGANHQDAVTFSRPGFNNISASSGYAFFPNNQLLFSTLNGTDPTGGLGFIIIELKYKIKNF